jgi:hypothetical protein
MFIDIKKSDNSSFISGFIGFDSTNGISGEYSGEYFGTDTSKYFTIGCVKESFKK